MNNRTRNLSSDILSATAAIVLAAVMLLSTIEVMTTALGDYWFSHEFDKYSVLEDVRGDMTMEAATGVMHDIMEYMMGRSDDINVYAVNEGVNRPFLSLDAQQHMTDCRGIVEHLKVFRVIGVAVFVMLVIYIKKKGELRLRGILYGFVAAAVVVLAAVALAGGFSGAFVLFHELAFDNDLWLIDPNVDNLINLLPEGFFEDTCVTAAIATLIETTLIFVGIKHI